MVALQSFNTEEVKTTSGGRGNPHVPDGKYKAVIIGSSMEDSPFDSNKPQDLVLRVVITEGPHKDTELEHRLGINDHTPIKTDKPDFTWSRAAYGNIGQIAAAFGMQQTPADSSQLHNRPLLIETATRKGKDKESGAHKPEWDSSYIKAYHALPAVGLPGAPQPAAQPSGVATPPWKQ